MSSWSCPRCGYDGPPDTVAYPAQVYKYDAPAIGEWIPTGGELVAMDLYKHACPRCGSDEIEEVEPTERGQT